MQLVQDKKIKSPGRFSAEAFDGFGLGPPVKCCKGKGSNGYWYEIKTASLFRFKIRRGTKASQ